MINRLKDTDTKVSAVSVADKQNSDLTPSLGTIRGVVTGEPHRDSGKIYDVFIDMGVGKGTVPIKYAKTPRHAGELSERLPGRTPQVTKGLQILKMVSGSRDSRPRVTDIGGYWCQTLNCENVCCYTAVYT